MEDNTLKSLEYESSYEFIYKEVRNYNTALLAILPKITGALSALGSAYIIQDVLRDPRKRKEGIFHRLMLGLSVMDFLFSFFSYVLSTWPMPKGYLKYAVGTVGTCDAVGFFQALTIFSIPLYVSSLATFFLIRLKLNWIDQRIKAVEKWFHIVPWSVGLVTGILGLATKSFGPVSFNCG